MAYKNYDKKRNAKNGASNEKTNFKSRKNAGKNGSSRNRGVAGREDKYDKYNSKANEGTTEARNDFSWYGGGSPLMEQAAKLSFGTALGMEPGLKAVQNENVKVGTFNVPGIMALNVLPVPGYAKDWTSPVNVCARAIYSFVRHANSGHSNYDGNDLMMYILGMDQIYTYYAWMCRLYGSMRTVIARNRFLPKAAVLVQGGNYEDLATNMADFLFYINQFASKVNAMSVPNTMSLYKRHQWLFSSIFADQPVDKCQMYVLRPAAIGVYNSTYSDATPAIEWVDMTPPISNKFTGMTYAQIKNLGDRLLNAILNDEDANVMSGDILKAYGSENCVKMTGIDAGYAVVPTFEPEFLLQLHNAHFVVETDPSVFPPITQDNEEGSAALGCIKFCPDITYTIDSNKEPADGDGYSNRRQDIMALCYNQIIDMPVNDVNSTLISIATRWQMSADVQFGNGGKVSYQLMDFGSEIITGVWMIGNKPVKDSSAKNEYSWHPIYANSTAANENSAVNGFNIGQTFSERPIIYDTKHKFNGSNWTEVKLDGIGGTLTNFTVTSRNLLENVHMVAMHFLYGLG